MIFVDDGVCVVVDEDRLSLLFERSWFTWVVEVGESDVRVMSIFDLWCVFLFGEVLGDVRIWRVGCECWMLVIEVPEIVCVLRVSLYEVPVQVEDDRLWVTMDYVSVFL